MKRKSFRNAWAVRCLCRCCAFFAVFSSFAPGICRATAELDRQFALETVGYLRAWDNMDGLFAEYVAQAYKDYFSRQSRFVLQDLSKADVLLAKAKTPYNKLIEDKEIVGQVARSMRSESVIRTKVFKEGSRYRFTVDWLHAPRMELLASETVVAEEQHEGGSVGIGDTRQTLAKALDAILKKIPFQGQVTGRDAESVTVNIGLNAGLKKGDTLVLATIDEVKRHPLLQAVVDWRLTSVGKVEVTEVDEGLAFAKVVEEEPNRQISRYQKIIQIIPKPLETRPVAEAGDHRLETPVLGWAAGGLWIGSFSRQDSALNSTAGKQGSGVFFGVKGDLQLWLTREWFTELGLGYGFSGYGQQDIATGAPTSAGNVSMTMTAVRLDLGYTYFLTKDVHGPKAWARVGYSSASYTLPVLASEQTGSVSFSGPFLGIGADLPIRGNYGAELAIDFGLLTSATETGYTTGKGQGASAVEVFAGGYYRLNTRATARLGMDLVSDNADMSNGASVTHRIVSLGPSLVFFF